MSAFRVDTKTIDRILSVASLDERERMIEDLSRFARGELVIGSPVEDKLTRIGQAMLALNCRAVDRRYNETNPVPPYEFRFRSCTPIESYVALRCLRYQCNEGDVPDDPFYKALDEMSNDRAHALVRALPAYDKAEWG